MRYVEFAEIRCSALGFGCSAVMGRIGRRESLRAMQTAWNAGITLFDTARSYGYGEAEGLLGEFLHGKREQATVVTKFGIMPEKLPRWKREARPLVRGLLRAAPGLRAAVRRANATEMTPGHFDVATLRSSLETSLRDLRTEYVDALLAHEAPASIMAQDDLMAELEKIVCEGKARRVGISATGRDAVTVALRGPALLSVLQFPAMGISIRPKGAGEDRFWIASHPFGGVDRAKQMASELAAISDDGRINSALRKKLRGHAARRLAEYRFAKTIRESRPHVIVASMLTLEHVRANAAAISDAVLPEDIAATDRFIKT